MKIIINTICLFVISASICLAATPLRWAFEASRPVQQTWEIYHGESVSLEPTILEDGTPASYPTNSVATLYYQTNNMGSVWYEAPASIISNTVVAEWTPSLDCGASTYRFFISVVAPGGSRSYRANGKLTMMDSPGAIPNELELPVKTIDFSKIDIVNAPWAEASDVELIGQSITALSNRVESIVANGGGIVEESDPHALPIAQQALVAATNAQATASAAYTVGTNSVAIATTANTSATNAAALAQAAHTAATNAQATAGGALDTATNAVSLIEALPDNGSVWRSTIMGDSTNWLSIAGDVPYINRKAATADIRVVAVANGEMYFQTYNGPPVGTVWKSTGSDTWAATNGWILTRQLGDVWWIQGESMPPVAYMSPEGSEPPATLAGMDFGNGSLVIDWVYRTEASRLLEAPDVETLAPSNWVESVRGVWTDVATNVTYSVVVSNGHWLVREVK